MTRVLITNDDGIAAPGLAALAAAARRHGFDVVVAAPSREMSGMSAALRIEGTTFRRTGAGFAVDATPASIVGLAARGAFGEPPDVVLAGVNRGANVGVGILHSGTVGAVLTAANAGRRGLAVSLDVLRPGGDLSEPPDDELPWPAAADVAAGLFDQVAAAPPGTILNLNVPGRVPVAGLRTATLAPFGQVELVISASGENSVEPGVERSTARAPGSDIDLLGEGFATVTAIQPPAAVGLPFVPAQRTSHGEQPEPLSGSSELDARPEL
ncbi:5'/3'-nucleotidase SurE [Actinoplanes sp. NPDC051411]|uniref:5'/3'-nucleotidase SurE n=1 Tax=Actinoplanes sp. NPDC051411 TaxID=3155522 RepID=UPI003416FA4A